MLTDIIEESGKLYERTSLIHKYMKPEILDTTLRDGEQTEGVAFSSQEKLTIAKKLLQLGVDRIEVASSGVTEEEFKAVKVICNYAQKRGYLDRIEVLGFVNRKSIDWIYDSGCKTVNLLCKGSLKHATEQLKKTEQEHLADIEDITKYATEKGINVNVYLEDWSNGMLESKDYVYYLIQGLRKTDVKRIMLPDTLGILSPEQVFKFIKEIKEKFPGRYDFHAHNDYGLGTINTIHAVLAEIDGVHTTINNMGERAGNASLIEIAVALKDLYNIDLGLKESKFQELSDLVARFSGKKPAHNAPIVGNINTQIAGIHADGDKKGELYQTKLRPERFGKGTIRYALGKMVGKASIELNLAELGITDLTQDQIKKLRDEVSRLGQEKESVTQSDLLFLIADLFEQPERVPFKILECRISADLNGTRQAYVKFDYKETIMESEATGDGQYDAFMKAIKSKLHEMGIEIPDLIDYIIEIPPGGKTSALTQSSITWTNGKKLHTIGIETDQTFAAIKATEKMLNFILRN